MSEIYITLNVCLVLLLYLYLYIDIYLLVQLVQQDQKDLILLGHNGALVDLKAQ